MAGGRGCPVARGRWPAGGLPWLRPRGPSYGRSFCSPPACPSAGGGGHGLGMGGSLPPPFVPWAPPPNLCAAGGGSGLGGAMEDTWLGTRDINDMARDSVSLPAPGVTEELHPHLRVTPPQQHPLTPPITDHPAWPLPTSVSPRTDTAGLGTPRGVATEPGPPPKDTHQALCTPPQSRALGPSRNTHVGVPGPPPPQILHWTLSPPDSPVGPSITYTQGERPPLHCAPPNTCTGPAASPPKHREWVLNPPQTPTTRSQDTPSPIYTHGVMPPPQKKHTLGDIGPSQGRKRG